jgi:hypothetical protein
MRIFLLTPALGLLFVAPAAPQIGGAIGGRDTAPPRAQMRTVPRPEPVADIRLLMLGINLPNYQGIAQRLEQQRQDAESWNILFGQALLIAENGNLLMLRSPPGNGREDTWLDRAAELRSTAVRVARAASDHDGARTRDEFKQLTNVCNRCHQTFRVDVKIGEQGGGSAIPRPPKPPAVPQAPAPPSPPAPPKPPRPPAVGL